MSAEQQTQDAEQEEEREELAWINQTPTTQISGIPTDIIYAGSLDSYTEQNGTSFGIVLEDVTTPLGELFVNQKKPEGGVTDEDDKRSTDYRVVDTADEGTTVTELNGEEFVSDRSGASFERAESVGEDRVIVWYNGMAGQIIGRALDFNGLPYAEYKNDGYLMKGLFQFPEGWRDNRRKCLKANRKPRVARFPILRPDVAGERITISIGRYNGGRMYEAHVYEGEGTDGEEIEMRYADDADDVMAEEGASMALYHGQGWQDEPSNAQSSGDSGGDDFDIQVGTTEDADNDGLSETQQAFVNSASQALEGTDLEPDEAFDGGIEGLMDTHGVDGDVEDIRAALYENVSHLDAADL